jgi:hypothetical protein
MPKKRTKPPLRTVFVERTSRRTILIDIEPDGVCLIHEKTHDLHTDLVRTWVVKKGLRTAKAMAAKIKAAPRHSAHDTTPI